MKISVPRTLEEWNERGRDYFPGHVGLECQKVEPEEVIARFCIRKSLLSWNGFLHAGTVVTLADTCCGYGTLCALPEGADGFTTIDLSSNFVGAALDGHVECTAKPLHQGRTTQVGDAEVSSVKTGKIMAHFRCSQMILWPRAQ